MLNTEWIQKCAEDSTPNTEKVAEAMAGAIINRLRDQMSNFTASHPMGTPVPRAFCVSGFRVYQSQEMSVDVRDRVMEIIKGKGLFVSTAPAMIRDGGNTYGVGLDQEAADSVAAGR